MESAMNTDEHSKEYLRDCIKSYRQQANEASALAEKLNQEAIDAQHKLDDITTLESGYKRGEVLYVTDAYIEACKANGMRVWYSSVVVGTVYEDGMMLVDTDMDLERFPQTIGEGRGHMSIPAMYVPLLQRGIA